MIKTQKLYTKRGKQLPKIPWDSYPRPQLKRNSFINLNGEWDFAVAGEQQPQQFDRKILVPFCPESLLSGVDCVFNENSTLWYKRSFKKPEMQDNTRLLLHFGAVDQKAKVFINGVLVGTHTGGYDAFCFDITDCLKAENELIVSVTDTLSNYILPYGKQCAKRGGMWYTPVSGLWQTVWLEVVPETHIKSLKINVGQDFAEITAKGIEYGEIAIQTEQGEIKAPLVNGKARVTINQPHLWSPEDPYLYYFTVCSGEDRVESYFALRTLTIKQVNGLSRLCLNGKPYFFHGLLDQGYWSDGIYTPADPECFSDDILAMKSLGFNMLRKHIKVEPEQFYYDCDRLGMVVFQDMVNNSDYSFFRDTALPTVGVINKKDKRMHKNPKSRQAFVDGMLSTVNQLYNHPSICCWTIFNEGWGQFCGDEMYDKLKALDNSRFIDTASGWFSVKNTDVCSRHIYFKKLKLKATEKPLFLSEFGGYSCKINNHSFNLSKTYGYGKFATKEEFSKAFCRLYKEEVMPLVEKGLCATVYTQVSDVEDETNGLLTYDRAVLKVDVDEIKNISESIKSLLK